MNTETKLDPVVEAVRAPHGRAGHWETPPDGGYMKAIWLAVGVVFGGVVLALAAVKVANELKMTKAYDAQAMEQKRIADIMETEKDLSQKEFEVTGTCKVSRFAYRNMSVRLSPDPLVGKLMTRITCEDLR